MSRIPRIISNSGVYHVMLRAVNQRQIFFDDADYLYYIRLLKHYKTVSGYQLYAYCLMGNHVHLLIKEGPEKLATAFQRIGAAFAIWYNGKYERVGHIFQGRFKSEPVDTQNYLFTVLRYILRNPVAAGICLSPADYSYSNASVYFGYPDNLTDADFIFSLIDPKNLRQFILQDNQDSCLEISPKVRNRMPDEKASELILREFGTLTPLVGRKKDRASFDMSVSKLFRAGISIRQLSRLTGISKGILQRVKL